MQQSDYQDRNKLLKICKNIGKIYDGQLQRSKGHFGQPIKMWNPVTTYLEYQDSLSTRHVTTETPYPETTLTTQLDSSHL
jgi:hypothetical protein